MKLFASDNNANVHPAVLQALTKVNCGLEKAYGDDRWTKQALSLFKEAFGVQAEPWFVFLGTAANVLGLKCLVRSYEAVICSELAHINTDECGAPEAVIGSKLLSVPARNGKISLDDCSGFLELRSAVHHSYPKVLSITQLTECGTAYSLDELHSIARFCRENSLFLHMDGARLCNAAASLNVSLKTLTTDVGVDVLSFGGTKNGLLFGEAVVILNRQVGESFPYFRKQFMQLGSKMRYLAAQFIAYFENDLCLGNARQANAAAKLLAEAIQDLPHVQLAYPVDGNMVFVRLPTVCKERLAQKYYFYDIETAPSAEYPVDWHLVRLMTSFGTTEQEVLELAADMANMA